MYGNPQSIDSYEEQNPIFLKDHILYVLIFCTGGKKNQAHMYEVQDPYRISSPATMHLIFVGYFSSRLSFLDLRRASRTLTDNQIEASEVDISSAQQIFGFDKFKWISH